MKWEENTREDDSRTECVHTMIPTSPKIAAALRRAEAALVGDSNDEKHDALWALVNAHAKAADAEPSLAPLIPFDGTRMNIPTYNGKWLEEHPALEEFDEPEVPILVCPVDGLRIVLGTHDYHDYKKPDIQVERRHNGWMIFLHPLGGCNACGYVVFLDDGRSYVTAEKGAGDYRIEVVAFKDATAELDDIKHSGPSCAPTMISHRRTLEKN